MARGEYLAIMDSDDIAALDRLEKQVEFMDNNKEIQVLRSNYEIVDEEGKTTGKVQVFNNP